MTGTPVNVSASAAEGSFSSGTFSPSIVTDSPSQARCSSSRPASGSALREGAPRLEGSEQGRQRHLHPRSHQIAAGLRGVDRPGGRRQRRADARPAIAHRQAVDFQLGDRDERTARDLPRAWRPDRRRPRSSRTTASWCHPAGRLPGHRRRRRPPRETSCTGPPRSAVAGRIVPAPRRCLRETETRRRRPRTPGCTRAGRCCVRGCRTARPARRGRRDRPAWPSSACASGRARPRGDRRTGRTARSRRARCASTSSGRRW